MSRDILLDYGIDIPGRCIDITDRGEAGIDAELATRFYTGLRLIRGSAPIKILISCTGGDDDFTRGIIGAMKADGRTFIGQVNGVAESAAAWIFQHCHKRLMTSHSSLMFHLGDSTKNKHNKYVDRLFVEDVWARMKEKDPSYPRSKLMAHLETDWYIYPAQAVELGLADEIIE